MDLHPGYAQYHPLLSDDSKFFAIIEKNGKLLATTSKVANLIGYCTKEQMIGSTQYDNFSHSVNSVDEFIKQDQAVITKHSHLTILDLHTYHDKNTHIFITTKKPVIYKSETIGMAALSQPIPTEVYTYLFGTLVGDNNNTIRKRNDYFSCLSSRQKQCLYYMILGYPSSKISNILNIGKRTVDSYIEEIKIKYRCSTRSEIIYLALQHRILGNYLNYSKELVSVSHIISTF